VPRYIHNEHQRTGVLKTSGHDKVARADEDEDSEDEEEDFEEEEW
jgi:hypothetical protein